MKKFISLICWIPVLCSVAGLYAAGRPDGVIADSTVTFIDGLVAPYNGLLGGDTLFLTGGSRPMLIIKNLHGDSVSPVVIINQHGVVRINTDHYFGISVENSSFFRLSGVGDPEQFYGIRIERVANGAGVGIGHNCTDMEIDHISITGCPIGGLYVKTDPDCSFTGTRDKFTQRNTVIHDNYIAGVGNEGMYVGSSKYFGQIVQCNGRDTLLLPSLLKGVRIYNNIIDRSGWDGIQVSSASEDCRIYDNLILSDSQAEFAGQMAGILIGGGSSCDCYNNYIAGGKGTGIEIHGSGNSLIYNNVIENAGLNYKPGDLQAMKYGIYVTDISTVANRSFYLLFNDIINPKSDGIRFASVRSRQNMIAFNAIINPGNFDYYENGSFLVKGIDAYLMIPDKGSDVQTGYNFFSRSIGQAGFTLPGYMLAPSSPLIDAGIQMARGITFDFYHRPRPFNGAYDIGAAEFDPQFMPAPETENRPLARPVLKPNPVRQTLTLEHFFDKPASVWMKILNMSGQIVLTKEYRQEQPGLHLIVCKVEKLQSGFYFYEIRVDSVSFTGKFFKLP